jgi:hypothetical protein
MNIGQMQNLATVRRPQEGRDAYGDVTITYAVGGELWLSLKRAPGAVQDYGAGDQPTGRARGLSHVGPDVQVLDVLEINAGPDAGTAWRVLDVFHVGGDLDMTLERFTGSLA